ncbi:hypothetical protein [Paraburkholderia caledonica]|uniref:hypothetical protein n=1 Tax=Paraburkholderia caledonica TaxID=134536 RepID=UPI000DEFE9FF|nr:hypothetical protein [Paraburkholderia caledonica]AXF16417.1 hypothetical protein CUJ87_18245 [Paraburkholderia caledonica]
MPKTSASPFALVERAIISLYDGGVLSPAVLERLLAVFAQENTDWDTEPSQRTVDGRSLHEVVVLTMLPGESLRSASKSFLSVIEHIAGVSRTKNPASAAEDVNDHEEESADQDDDSAELAQQLSGSARATRRGRAANVKDKAKDTAKKRDSDAPTQQPKRTAAFNPLLNAAAPRKSKS